MSGNKKMSKRTISLLVGLAVIVLLGGALAFLLLNDGGADDTSSVSSALPAEYLITGKSADDIKTIDITNETGSYTVAKGADSYVIASYLSPETGETVSIGSGTKFLDTAIESLAEGLFTATVTDTIEGGADDLALYGLTAPTASIAVHYQDGTSYSFDIGNEAPDGKSYYVFDSAKKEVCLIKKSDLSRSVNAKEAYADLTLTPVQEEGAEPPVIDSFVLGGSFRAEEIVLESEPTDDTSEYSSIINSGYLVTIPKKKTASASTIGDITEVLWSASATSTVYLDPTPEQLAATGLASPYSTLSLTYEGKTITLSLGSKTEDGGYYCTTSLNTPVFTVSADLVPWVEYTPFNLYDKFACIPNINDVSAVTVEFGGKSHRFEVGHGEDDAVLATYDGKDLPEDAFKAYYQLLISAMGEYEATEVAEDAPIQLKYTYEFVNQARADSVVEFVTLSDRQCAIISNGDLSFSIRSKYVDKVKADLDKVLAGEKIIVDW
ncbi:MAG: DUF4340 domain-containing protein [Acetanaerobacterium sp.]